MRFSDVAERLRMGIGVEFRPRGNSMRGLINSGDTVVLSPVVTKWRSLNIEPKDIVFCRVRGRYLLHLVTAKDAKGRYQISNNRGRVNGWTKQILGKVIEVNGSKHIHSAHK